MRLNVARLGAPIALALVVSSTGVAARQTGITDLKAHQKEVIVNIVGCVELESDFRKRTGDKRGGTLSSGAGTGNEFVLTYARSVPTEGIKTDKTYETVGTTGLEEVYTVTGNREDALKREVGRQVEVTGYVEVDNSKGTLKVKDLPRLNASSWTRVQDYCPMPKKK
jgi:hypothetical protein